MRSDDGKISDVCTVCFALHFFSVYLPNRLCDNVIYKKSVNFYDTNAPLAGNAPYTPITLTF